MLCTNQKCNRRTFLEKSAKLGAAMCLSCAIPSLITSCSHKQNREVSPENYYISRKTELLNDFDKWVMNPCQKVLGKSMSESDANDLLKSARKEYDAIIPVIPYIGGDENENSTMQLVFAARNLALYRVLISNGKYLKEAGQIIYDTFDTFLQSGPRVLVSVYGYFKFHFGRDEKIKKYSEMSLKHKYPMDFVYTFIEGDGKNLYYGNDMLECAIKKFLIKENAVELLPYMCAGDYLTSKRFNRRLVRTKTLAESDVCDFRYMIDHETQVNLSPGLKV